MKKTLKEFLAKGSKRPKAVAFAFGRMNPPTAGHEKLIQKVESIAKRIKGDAIVYVSASQDKDKNPLDVRTKIKYLQPLYPDVQFKPATGNTRTFMEVLKNDLNNKYSDVYMIGGSDRVSEFKKLITTYNGKDYDFDKTEVMSAGERDPDAQGTTGISGTKMRMFAVKGDYNNFRKGLPVKMKDADGKNLFKDLRTAMGIKSTYGFGVQMKPVMSLEDFEKQELRQEYMEENVFNIGDYVENMNDCTIGKIIKRGTNYLVYEMEDGGVKKAWLHECVAVDSTQIEMMESTNVKKEKVKDVVLQKNSDALDEDDDDFLEDIKVSTKDYGRNQQDPDVKDVKGTQPKKYYKGMSDAEKEKRAKHFAKDRGDSDKPAPGDADAKTTPSKYTKKYKQMFGEACWDGFKQVGMKMKNGKQVPNCVPEEMSVEEAMNVPGYIPESSHFLNPKLPLKHQMTHARTRVDVDVDGDVDILDKVAPVPDEITGTEKQDMTKKMMKKYDKEKKHTKIGVAFERYEIGTPEYTAHTKDITPGEKKENKFKVAPHIAKFDPIEYGIKLKDIKEWAENENTIAKYQKRYGDEYEQILESVVAKMIEKIEVTEEKIEGLVNKSEKSGIPYGILKKVFDRGMAAWRGGHRPGATQHQWAFARVNSFITGGGARKADNDLWQQAKGKKEEIQKRLKSFNETI